MAKVRRRRPPSISDSGENGAPHAANDFMDDSMGTNDTARVMEAGYINNIQPNIAAVPPLRQASPFTRTQPGRLRVPIHREEQVQQRHHRRHHERVRGHLTARLPHLFVPALELRRLVLGAAPRCRRRCLPLRHLQSARRSTPLLVSPSCAVHPRERTADA